MFITENTLSFAGRYIFTQCIQAGTEPKNPIFYERYVDVFGDQQDKKILGELLAKKDDKKEDQE